MTQSDPDDIETDGASITRTCASCGEDIRVIVYPDKSYDGGHYFGEMRFPTDDAELVDEHTETFELKDEDDWSVKVVEYSDYEEVEYWECDHCYHLLDEDEE